MLVQVTLLDPVRFPGAIKVFAREICRNDLLNFGRLHFFFPDSRLALDLSTDKTLKEARFDRHFVRDLVWSRHQLEELAERRFRAAQVGFDVAVCSVALLWQLRVLSDTAAHQHLTLGVEIEYRKGDVLPGHGMCTASHGSVLIVQQLKYHRSVCWLPDYW